MRKRRIILAAVVLALLVGIVVIAWRVNDWPPPRLILKYGFPPTGGPTGNKRVIEGIEFIELKPGYFRMGTHRFCKDGDLLGRVAAALGLSWGNPPQHVSSLCPTRWAEAPGSFWIASTEVTVATWKRYLRDQKTPVPVSRPEPADLPAIVRTPQEVAGFCSWMSGRGGVAVRVPVEAEWEFACRAGASTLYHFGDDEADLPEHAWFAGTGPGQIHPVGRKLANAWGLHDMHGNLWELCSDASPPPRGEALVHPAPTVLRGGSSGNPAQNQWCGMRCEWQRFTPTMLRGFPNLVGVRPVFTLPEDE